MKSCKGCIHENLESQDCMHCARAYTDEYERKTKPTNFDMCCKSIENMAQSIDIMKCGWTKEQIIEWLNNTVD